MKITRNEKEFLEWLNKVPYKFFESNDKIYLRHYVFGINGKFFHISFSKRDTVICGIALDQSTGTEKTIYKGYSWDYCLAEINKKIGGK